MILNYVCCIAFIFNTFLCLAQSNELEILSSKADSIAKISSPQISQLKDELELRQAILKIYKSPDYLSTKKAELNITYGSTLKLDSLIKEAYGMYLIHESSEGAAAYKIKLYDLLKLKESWISVEGEELSSEKTSLPELQSLVDNEEQRIKTLKNKIQKQGNLTKSIEPEKPLTTNAELFNPSSIIKQVIIANMESGREYTLRINIDNKSFEDRKAFMPVPLAKSIVSKRYKPSSNSIELSSEESIVSSVAQGEVIYAKRLGGADYTLIIMHDNNYFTVFSGLQNVFVGYGDMVNYMQDIGAAKKLGDYRFKLSFGIWKASKSIDPIHWIKNG